MKDLICKLVSKDPDPVTISEVVKRVTHKVSSEYIIPEYSVNTESHSVTDYKIGIRRPKRVFLTQIKGFAG